MVSESVFRTLNSAHRAVLRLSGGRLGWYFPIYRMSVVELTTTGRKSGQPRTTMLTVPHREGEDIVVVASAGGNDRHPAWYHNIQSNPEVTVVTGREAPRPMRAETATPEERARLWPIITREHANYAGYQRKTSREIPLVILRPRGDG
ncbi:MAG: nitroreductase family deazaflavin-dependent oxidoreductase [Acidimicrobiales bacterium]|nr:nitroreductase family deazaflavin-dependent oxidoreductase [Acidimicrobiales bacterium]